MILLSHEPASVPAPAPATAHSPSPSPSPSAGMTSLDELKIAIPKTSLVAMTAFNGRTMTPSALAPQFGGVSSIRTSLSLNVDSHGQASPFAAFSPHFAAASPSNRCRSPSMKQVSPMLIGLQGAPSPSISPFKAIQSPRTVAQANSIWDQQWQPTWSPFNAKTQPPSQSQSQQQSAKGTPGVSRTFSWSYDADGGDKDKGDVDDSDSDSSTDSESDSDDEKQPAVTTSSTNAKNSANWSTGFSVNDFDFNPVFPAAANAGPSSTGSTPAISPKTNKPRLNVSIEDPIAITNAPPRMAIAAQSIVAIQPSQAALDAAALLKRNTEANKYIAATPAELFNDLETPKTVKNKPLNKNGRPPVSFADDHSKSLAQVHLVPDDETQYAIPKKKKKKGKGKANEKPCKVM